MAKASRSLSYDRPRPAVAFEDYHRTVIGFHGTDRDTAARLVDGKPFESSRNDYDWLGSGVYFWEHAPQRAWTWADDRHGEHAAVVGAIIRLGRCFDLLDPVNVETVRRWHNLLETSGFPLRENAHGKKYRDCAVFNSLYAAYDEQGEEVESVRAVYVPSSNHGRIFRRSWIHAEAHIQISVRKQANILAAWPVRRDGRRGREEAAL
jgi:hypothetical protein